MLLFQNNFNLNQLKNMLNLMKGLSLNIYWALMN